MIQRGKKKNKLVLSQQNMQEYMKRYIKKQIFCLFLSIKSGMNKLKGEQLSWLPSFYRITEEAK